MSRFIICGVSALLLIAASAAVAAPPSVPSSMRKNLQHHDLKHSDREVFQSEVHLEAGGTFPRHNHPGEEFIYVLKGTWEYQLDGQPPVIVKTGEALFIPYGAVHSAKNIGEDAGIELATHVVEKGKPVLTLAK